MRLLVQRLRTTFSSLSCRPLRDLCYTFVVVAAASALLTYHLSRQLPSSTRRRVPDDDRRTAPLRYRRRAGEPPDTDRGAPVDVRRVLEGLEARRNTANVEETSWNEHDDDLDSTYTEEVSGYNKYTRNTLDCDQSNYSSHIVFFHIPIEFGQTGISAI